ncbi:MAG: cytochrome c-type biogenesis protein CcmH [Burkholderiaceae bacterium]|nr:cytochrome c-type biogenesis protein CcmH [Burkholderiaceae bacterium]
MTQPSPPPLDAAGQARLRTLSEELRCLVCQNQTLADSHADLAIDLRNQVQELIAAGKTNAEIKQYLVERYGDFVLYRPPVQANTALLWGGPFALLAGGGLIWAIVQRRSRLAAGPGGQSPAAKASASVPGLPVDNASPPGRTGAAPATGRAEPAGSAGSAGTATTGQATPEQAKPGLGSSGMDAPPGVPASADAGSHGVAGTAVAGSIVAGSAVPGAAGMLTATRMTPPAAPAPAASPRAPDKPVATGLERARRLLDD